MAKLNSFIAISMALGALHAPATAQLPSASLTASLAEAAPLQAFFADEFHCSNMAALVENQDERETARFEADIAKAVAAWRRANPRASYDRALFAIKASCDAQLLADAGAAPGKPVKLKR